ncbi:MAG: DUF4238 domain-containing protein [Clostridiales bacterium]|nr:DUF4238 domain-containing protein [Clostridiales bacterium]
MGNKQHTVPVCYLANFGINGNEQRLSWIYYYSILDDKGGMCRVDNIAYENGFYNIDELGKQKEIIENMYANMVEPELTEILKRLYSLIKINPSERESSIIRLSNDEKEHMAAIIAMLLTRTRSYRNRYKNIFGQLEQSFPDGVIPHYKKEDYQRIHTQAIIGFQDSNFFANLLNDRNWVFLINHTEIPFLTSDNPVVQINHSEEEHLSPVDPRISFYYPLSPNIGLEIYHKDTLKTDMGYFDVYLDKHVEWYNTNISCYCSRHVFSNKDISEFGYQNLFDGIRKLVK